MKDKIIELLNVLRPTLQADGGDVEFVDFNPKTGEVKVRLQGACQSCPLSSITLKESIEKYLKAEIPEIKEVVSV
jgi:Fe-S cluster biogenesis protein NfuA